MADWLLDTIGSFSSYGNGCGQHRFLKVSTGGFPEVGESFGLYTANPGVGDDTGGGGELFTDAAGLYLHSISSAGSPATIRLVAHQPHNDASQSARVSNVLVYSFTGTGSSLATCPNYWPTLPVLAADPGDGSVLLSWSAAVFADARNIGVVEYDVHRAVGAGSFSTIATVTATSYIDTTAINGVTYRYRIFCRFEFGAAGLSIGRAIAPSTDSSAVSNEATATPEAGLSPGGPVTLAVDSIRYRIGPSAVQPMLLGGTRLGDPPGPFGLGETVDLLQTLEGSPTSGIENARRGWVVAASADATTILIGVPFDASANAILGEHGSCSRESVSGSIGAAFVFVYEEGGWVQQAKLVPPGGDYLDGTKPFFGMSVALSADGNTALISGQGADFGMPIPETIDNEVEPWTCSFYSEGGTAWVFVRDEAGNWEVEARLDRTSVDPDLMLQDFGWDADLSADGNTALVVEDVRRNDDDELGGYGKVFERVAGEWDGGVDLFPTGYTGPFGPIFKTGVISADGLTVVLAGIRLDAGSLGPRLFTWTRPDRASSFVYLDATVVGSPGSAPDTGYNEGLAISGNGLALFCGYYYGHTTAVGKMYRRAAVGDPWSEDGVIEPLDHDSTGADPDRLGTAAFTYDGNTAVIGAPGEDGYSGRVWLYTRVDGEWVEDPDVLLVGAAVDEFGRSLALSDDGGYLVVGVPRFEDDGAVHVYAIEAAGEDADGITLEQIRYRIGG